MLFFPKEFQTTVEVIVGFIFIEQTKDDGSKECVRLTVHQFQEIWNREKQVIEAALLDEENA